MDLSSKAKANFPNAPPEAPSQRAIRRRNFMKQRIYEDYIKKVFERLQDENGCTVDQIQKYVAEHQQMEDGPIIEKALEWLVKKRVLSENFGMYKRDFPKTGISEGNAATEVVKSRQRSRSPIECVQERPIECDQERHTESELERPIEGQQEHPIEGNRESPTAGDQENTIEGEQKRTIEDDQERSIESNQECPIEDEQKRSIKDNQEGFIEGIQERPIKDNQESFIEGIQERPIKDNQESFIEGIQERPTGVDQESPFEGDQERHIESDQERLIEGDQKWTAESDLKIPKRTRRRRPRKWVICPELLAENLVVEEPAADEGGGE